VAFFAKHLQSSHGKTEIPRKPTGQLASEPRIEPEASRTRSKISNP
jgi:hypothetical protein